MIGLSKHWAITLSHLKSSVQRLTLLKEVSWALFFFGRNRAAVRVSDTLQFPSLISKQKLISLVSFCVCVRTCMRVCSLQDYITFAELCLNKKQTLISDLLTIVCLLDDRDNFDARSPQRHLRARNQFQLDQSCGIL